MLTSYVTEPMKYKKYEEQNAPSTLGATNPQTESPSLHSGVSNMSHMTGHFSRGCRMTCFTLRIKGYDFGKVGQFF